MNKISLMKRKNFVTYATKKKKNNNNTNENGKNAFKYHKVRDHCHKTGRFREAVHSICNLRYKTPKEIPVYFIMILHMIITSLVNS